MGFRLKSSIVALGLTFVAMNTGCVSLTTYQSAQTIPNNGSQFGIAASTTTISGTGLDKLGIDAAGSLPSFDIWYRKAFTDKLEVGGKFFPIGGMVDAKYQVVDQPKLDVAVDLGIAHTSFESGNYKSSITDLYPQVLVTYTVNDWLSATLTPKLVTRIASVDDAGSTSSDTSFIPGATVSLGIGKPGGFQFIPEFGYFVSGDASFMSLGAGVAF